MDEQLAKAANQWVRVNRRKLLSQLCDSSTYEPQIQPVSIFMAGTPGAGKTEFSIKLLEKFTVKMVRIDADEIREMMREVGYTGANAEAFQHAASKGVNILFDEALRKGYSAVLDGTFAYGNWRENIERSLRRNRLVEIYYLYQDPAIAWDYVKKREANQGRAVPLDIFVQAYVNSLKNAEKAKAIFKDKVTLYYAENNYEKDLKRLEVDIDQIANLIPKVYNEEELKGLLYARSDS